MSLESALRAAVGDEHVLTDADLRATYERDWTGEFVGSARAVVRPGNVTEVALAVRACDEAGAPVVPQGGNTGLVGGGVPDGSGSAVVLSTRRLTRLGPVDRAAGQVTLGAGITLGAAQHHARDAGLELAVDLAARDSATVGGMAATNAGGVHVLRYGTMRRQVVGFEAVLAGGAVLSHLAGLEKDNTGYDLGALLCGSEGTLAVLTAVRLRLVRPPAEVVTALLAWPDVGTMVEGLVALRARVPDLEAAEYVVRPGVELVMAAFGVADPFERPYPAYLLVEMSSPVDALDGLPGLLDAAVAAGPRQRDELWRLRELHTEALAAAGPPRKYDVSVPLSGLSEFLDEAVALVARHGAACHHFGHLGDGNVHLNVLGADGDTLDGVLLPLVATHGGSISAEHGIGRLKRPWLHLSRSPAEIAAMTAVKAALDPHGTLNPGVLL